MYISVSWQSFFNPIGCPCCCDLQSHGNGMWTRNCSNGWLWGGSDLNICSISWGMSQTKYLHTITGTPLLSSKHDYKDLSNYIPWNLPQRSVSPSSTSKVCIFNKNSEASYNLSQDRLPVKLLNRRSTMRYTCSILVKVQSSLKCFLLISFYLKHLKRVKVMINILHTGLLKWATIGRNMKTHFVVIKEILISRPQ